MVKGFPIVLLMCRRFTYDQERAFERAEGTLFQFFLSKETKKLMAIRQFCLRSSWFEG